MRKVLTDERPVTGGNHSTIGLDDQNRPDPDQSVVDDLQLVIAALESVLFRLPGGQSFKNVSNDAIRQQQLRRHVLFHNLGLGCQPLAFLGIDGIMRGV
ncbi:MAG: hypothetical protein NTY41_17410 [Proteobacteria bacterium]|nr:hypothetical protein [Pseudomonadota bacterium]